VQNEFLARTKRACSIALLLLLVSSTAFAQKQLETTQPIVLSPEQSVKEGRALVDEMLSQQPEENAVTGKMSIRTKKTFKTFPIKFQTILSPTNWSSLYSAMDTDVTVIHQGARPSEYRWHAPNGKIVTLTGDQATAPFADSDFSLADLGLEFLHWPDQRLLQKEMKRSRSCRVLESTNPHPVAGGYSRVKSWVDAESHGIVLAEAYDVKGEKVKEFAPKDFSKVNGQWQLEEMQISNTQTGSSTTVKFDLKQ
jgi:Outer membrane lipoprotein-sorting protein